MAARDVYKLLFQGIRGAEHIMPTPEIFETRLREELRALQPELNEPLTEMIRPDRQLSRVNLRAYLATSQDINWLVEVCSENRRAKVGNHGKTWLRSGRHFCMPSTRDPSPPSPKTKPGL